MRTIAVTALMVAALSAPATAAARSSSQDGAPRAICYEITDADGNVVFGPVCL